MSDFLDLFITTWQNMTLYQMFIGLLDICLFLISVIGVIKVGYLRNEPAKPIIVVGVVGTITVALAIILKTSSFFNLRLKDAATVTAGWFYNNGSSFIIIMIAILLVLMWNTCMKKS